MLIQQTFDRLHEMRLNGMVDELTAQTRQPDIRQLSFEERLGLLVDAEYIYRQDRRLTRLLREAKLRIPACMEDIDYRHQRGLDRALLQSLAQCRWVRSHQSILITGPTGCGKTYIICALANAACRQGFRARYYRLARFIAELAMAKGDGTHPKLLRKLARTDVLILDDWGLAPLTETESRELLEVIDDRVESRSTIIASQLPIAEWHGTMADPSAADAILDRLVHGAFKITLGGESMRKIQAGGSESL
ncbi:MAG: ATP-binding protein [Firmicutes bacterium]|nr:ATP-binding protein [Bacillota bacterium]